MNWRDVVSLLITGPTTNDIGDAISGTISTNQLFANKKSVRQSEHYQAMANGLKLEQMFEVRYLDYKALEDTIVAGQTMTRLTFNSKTYNIVRTFTKNDEIIELICDGLTNNN